MNLSRRINRLAPSATMAMSAKAQALKAAGRDIISLTVGEPDFPTPEYICQAAKDAVDARFTRYTAEPGILELRSAIAGYYTARYKTPAAAENTIAVNGGKQGLYNLFICLLDPGDEVLVPAPYWVSYPPMVELADGKTVIVPAGSEAGFKVTPATLEKYRTPKTKLLIFNSPSNPTGACYSREETDAIAQWAVDSGVIIVADEMYDQLVYTAEPYASLGPWWAKHPENFVICNGVSKSYAMTGWRMGYVLGEPNLIKAMTRLQGQTTSNISSVTQKAALAALSGSLDEVDAMRVAFRRRRDLAYTIISGWRDVLCPKPEGAFYLFPDVHRLYTKDMPDSTSLCGRLLEKAGVALVPGDPFGDDNCVRISYAVSDETLTRGLERISAFLYGQ